MDTLELGTEYEMYNVISKKQYNGKNQLQLQEITAAAAANSERQELPPHEKYQAWRMI
ncbi:MAG: hypothetical protein L7F77_12255 [Candidatus Magnetominusculus sp. LBB02]|nr:hypothetical protein [Candidatus Magnetominusculus sp. LBB02]